MKKLISTLGQQAKAKWYFPLILILALADAYILVVPNEALLIPAVLARPKHWVFTVFFFTMSSAIGATLLAAGSSQLGQAWAARNFPDLFHSSLLSQALTSMHLIGATQLLFISMTPLPQHVAVVMAGLSHMPLVSVFCSVLLGRLLKYLLISGLSLLGTKVKVT